MSDTDKRVPVYLTPDKWSQVFSRIASSDPLIAEMAPQVVAGLGGMKGNGDASARFGERSDQGTHASRQSAAQPQADHRHSDQQRTPGSPRR